MKILHTVEFYEPSKGGSQEVVKQLSEHMVDLGHSVTVATSRLSGRKSKSIQGVRIVEFGISGNEVRGYQGEIEKYKKFLLESEFDVIMNYAAQQWASDLFFEVMNKIETPKVFVPCGFSGLYLPEYKEYFKKMSLILKKYDATVYLSSNYRDINFAKKHKVKNTKVIANGANEKEFLNKAKWDVRKNLGLPVDTTIVYQGGCSFTGVKGQEESVKIYKKAKIDNSALVLAGNILNEKTYKKCKLNAKVFNNNPVNILKRRKIFIQTWDRKKIIAGFQQADVFLFPSNIEASPLVLFEACASKTPFLSTDVGNSKEIVGWTGGGKLLPTFKDKKGYSHAKISESAIMLKNLISNKEQMDRLAKRGYCNWKKNFSWDKISKSYLRLYQRIINK